MNENIKLSEFLTISRSVTENYLKAGYTWNDDNLRKIKEELKEFLEPTNSLNELEEFWDVFFACLTRLHLKKVHDYTILASAISTWNKIHNRSLEVLKKKHYCPECNTELELVNNYLESDATHWYCSTCKAGSA